MKKIEKYINYVIHKNYNMYTRFGIEKEDLIQTGYEAYYTLLMSEGSEVDTKRILNAINYGIKKHILHIQKQSNIVSFDDEADYVKSTVFLETEHGTLFSVDPCTLVEDDELLDSVLDCMDILTDQERHVVYSISWSDTPKSTTELARELGITKQRVSNIHKKATEKLTEEYNRKIN